jgi:hypothetical protein
MLRALDRVLRQMESEVNYTVEVAELDDSITSTQVHFRLWQHAVDYACPFVKSSKCRVTILRNGKKVSYYSRQTP